MEQAQIINTQSQTITATKSLSTDLMATSDFKLICSGGEVAVHKVLLSSKSPVFASMLQANTWREGRTGEMRIDNYSIQVVRAMVKFIYTGKVDMTLQGELMEDLFKAAHLCMLDGLKKICEMSLISGVTTTNAVQMMALGHKYEVAELKEKAKLTFLEAGLTILFDKFFMHDRDVILGDEFLEQSEWEEELKEVPELSVEVVKALLRKINASK